MLELLQVAPIQGVEIPVWIASMSASALMLLKGALWVRGAKNGSNGSSRIAAEAQGEFRGTVKTLISNQFELLQQMHESMEADRKMWSPTIQELLQNQKKTAEMLMVHDKQERKVWQQMIKEIQVFQKDSQAAWVVCHDKLDKLTDNK